MTRIQILAKIACVMVLVLSVCPRFCKGQPAASDGRLSEVLRVIDQNRDSDSQFSQSLQTPWWQYRTTEPINSDGEVVKASVNQLLHLAIANSARISIARHVPQIRSTAVAEAAAAFDWTHYAENMWADTSDPVGSSLTVGGAATRFRDHNLNLSTGLRHRMRTGGSFDISQQNGYQYNNSTFFVPGDQATSRIVLGYTQPLLRGRGAVYNTSLILLAEIDVESAGQEFQRQLQSHLLEVVSSYWSLYLERASLAQKYRLYQRTARIHEQLEMRQRIDAQRTQLVSARAALQTREADLIRAVAAVKNAETRLRSFINAPELNGDPNALEIIPAEHPITHDVPTDLYAEFTTAMSNRPEIKAAINSIKAASTRLKMSKNEILPQLNLVTETYVAGLRGDAEFGKAWMDQFRSGEPSYSAGIQYERPLGNRIAKARLSRRELEVSQLREEYRDKVQSVRAEIEISVREIETAYRELIAKNRSRQAAEMEAETLEARWREMVDVVSAGLSLESLLRAQERVTNAEFEFSRALLTYNLALVNLRKANGTMLTIVDGTGGLESSVPVATDQPTNSDTTVPTASGNQGNNSQPVPPEPVPPEPVPPKPVPPKPVPPKPVPPKLAPPLPPNLRSDGFSSIPIGE